REAGEPVDVARTDAAIAVQIEINLGVVEAAEVAHFVSDGFVKLVGSDFGIAGGAVADAVLKLAVENDQGGLNLSSDGIEFAMRSEADDERVQTQGLKERAVGVEDDRALGAGVAAGLGEIEI